MLAFFTENSLPLVIIGLLAAGVMLFTGWTARDRRLLIAGLLVAALTAALLIVERAIVTPAEEIKATVAAMADDLRANHTEQLVSYFAPARADLANETLQQMRFVTFESVSVKRNLRAKFLNPDQTRAEVTFNATARVKDARGRWQSQLIARYLIVQMDKVDGRWLVVDYQHRDPREGI